MEQTGAYDGGVNAITNGLIVGTRIGTSMGWHQSDAALDQHGDPYAVVRALSLVGVRGITRQAPRNQLKIVTLSFGVEQVIYAEGNVLVHAPFQRCRWAQCLTAHKVPMTYCP